MTRFVNGPAAGKVMMLRRSPPARFLRVTIRGVDFDALDMLDDEPREDEQLFAYRLTEYKGMAHLLMSPRKNSGWFPMSVYEFVEDQPADAVMRDGDRWREWCMAQKLVARIPQK